MAYYINAVASSGNLQGDINTLIPDAGMRRRMSRIVRSGVATAMECLGQLPQGEKADGVITATGMGCLADSEKFLRTMISNGERLLNPTPFIQSTFNTIGAQVALLTGNYGYNMTYSHGQTSFQAALADTLLKIGEGAGHILLGAVDEATPTLAMLAGRLGLLKGSHLGEGSYFFVVSGKPLPGCKAVIETFTFDGLRFGAGIPQDAPRLNYDEKEGGVFDTSPAKLLYGAIMAPDRKVKEVVLEAVSYDGRKTEISLGCFGGL